MGQDTKRLITGMVVALALLIGYQYLLHWWYPNWKPGQSDAPPAQPAKAAPPHPATSSTTQAGSTTTAAASVGAVTTAPAQPSWHARGDTVAGAPVLLGSAAKDDKSFAMA